MDESQVADFEAQAKSYYEKVESDAKDVYPEVLRKVIEATPGQGDIIRKIKSPADCVSIRGVNESQLERARVMKKNGDMEADGDEGEMVVNVVRVMQICQLSLPLTQATEWRFLPMSKAEVGDPVAIFDIVNVDAELKDFILVVVTETGTIGLLSGKSVLVA